MSRLAKKPVMIPTGVVLTEKGEVLSVKGPKGELRVKIPRSIKLELKEDSVMVLIGGESKQNKADAGTTWSLITNAVQGVTEGFRKVLEIEGVGFRAVVEGGKVVLSLGYVNPVKLDIPEGITASAEKSTLTIAGINKETVGQFAAKIRSMKKPEPYKGKGIRYQGEVVRRKAGKKAATTTG